MRTLTLAFEGWTHHITAFITWQVKSLSRLSHTAALAKRPVSPLFPSRDVSAVCWYTVGRALNNADLIRRMRSAASMPYVKLPGAQYRHKRRVNVYTGEGEGSGNTPDNPETTAGVSVRTHRTLGFAQAVPVSS